MQLLGGCTVSIGGSVAGAPANVKSRSLLAYLAVRRAVRVRRETLMAEFWPDAEPRNARNSLKTALAAIRKIFRDGGVEPDGVLVADREAVRWTAAVSLDVADVERCTLSDGAARSRAIAAYAAEFMPGDYHPWTAEPRARLAARFEDILRAELAAAPTVEIAERLLALDPYSDDAFAAMIEVALAGGKRREARAAYDRYVAALVEVGANPNPALEALVTGRTDRSDALLNGANDDAAVVAEFVALEPELDDDDLVALLDWSLERVVEAKARLDGPHAGAEPPPESRCSHSARRGMIARIAERLALHEGPQSKRRLAAHYVTLGRVRDAAHAFLEAATGFLAISAWTNAVAASDAGIGQLEPVATSVEATRALRELHVARGDALLQIGQSRAAIRAFGSALDLSDADRDAEFRVHAFVTVGHAFSRLNSLDSAWMAVHEARLAGARAGDLAKLEIDELAARLLLSGQRFHESIACASAAYDGAMALGAHRLASMLAQRVAEPLRRLLRFDECERWTELQLAAATVAGPEYEAQARYAAGALAYARDQLERSERSVREALRILERIRRRPRAAVMPIGLAEWHHRQALAHVLLRRGRIDAALIECRWLMRSPWTFNTSSYRAITFATVVDVWLAADTLPLRRAALELADRWVPLGEEEPSYFLDVLTRARLAAQQGSSPRAHALLHAAFAATVATEARMPDQVHISYEKLAAAATGIDDALAARAHEAGRRHHAAVTAAARTLVITSEAEGPRKAGYL